jgi:hypothetical protein
MWIWGYGCPGRRRRRWQVRCVLVDGDRRGGSRLRPAVDGNDCGRRRQATGVERDVAKLGSDDGATGGTNWSNPFFYPGNGATTEKQKPPGRGASAKPECGRGGWSIGCWFRKTERAGARDGAIGGWMVGSGTQKAIQYQYPGYNIVILYIYISDELTSDSLSRNNLAIFILLLPRTILSINLAIFILLLERVRLRRRSNCVTKKQLSSIDDKLYT